MKTTHTHRGHCQACGRVQAVDTTNNLLAKHGYTVDFGYFDGVCTGSEIKPLEVDKSFTEATIIRISEWIDGQIMVQGLTIVEYTEKNLRKHCEEYNQNSDWRTITFDEIFARFQKHYIKGIENGIANAIQHIESLQKLIAEVHGKELINVADTEKLLKDLEAEAKIGFDETKVRENRDGSTTKLFVSYEKEATKKTSIGLVGIKVSRPSVYVSWNDRVSVNCLLNGKRIARNKLIQKLQGDI